MPLKLSAAEREAMLDAIFDMRADTDHKMDGLRPEEYKLKELYEKAYGAGIERAAQRVEQATKQPMAGPFADLIRALLA